MPFQRGEPKIIWDELPAFGFLKMINSIVVVAGLERVAGVRIFFLSEMAFLCLSLGWRGLLFKQGRAGYLL